MKKVIYITILLFVNIFFISHPSRCIELNKTDEIQIRLCTLDKSITIFTLLNRQVMQMFEDIDFLEKNEIEKIINQYTILIDFLEKEISTDPLDNIYQENLDKFIQSSKKLFLEIATKQSKRVVMPSILPYSKDYIKKYVMRPPPNGDVPEDVENEDKTWPNNLKRSVVLALASADLKPYNYALKGFKYVCDCNIEKILITKSNELNILKRIYKNKPDIILAMGVDALSMAKIIKDIPIIYLMIVNPQSILSGEENITGVSMNIPPEKQLEIFKKAQPKLKRIGLLFDPNNTGFLVKRAQDAAKKLDIELIINKVDSYEKVPSLLINMKDKIDAFWMLPDITVFSPETIKYLFQFSMENKIPIFAFSEQFLEMGAMMSLSFNAFDLGKRAGELAEEILSGKDIRDLSAFEAREVEISINLRLAKKLGVEINNEVFNEAI